jgi:hypothetical protein
MKKYLLILSFLSCFTSQAVAQHESPYKTSTKVDLPVTLGGIALSSVGLYLISNKHGISDAQAARRIKPM